MSFVEPLEPRALFSGVSFNGQFLIIEGTSKGDRIRLSTDTRELSVRVTFNGRLTLFPMQPISSVRVQVAGITGMDPVSQDRVRLVAEQINAATGLDVDITIGA